MRKTSKNEDIGVEIKFVPEESYMEFTFMVNGEKVRTRSRLSNAGRDWHHCQVYTDTKK